MRRLPELLYGRQPGTEAEWRELLTLADRALCTPLLRDEPNLPRWFAAEALSRVEKNRHRRSALIETYASAAQALEEAGIEFVIIKGFTHEVDAGVEPVLRSQGDIDLLCAPADVTRSQAALQRHGFVFHGAAELSDNHARPLIKPNTWKWKGDYFDPTQPVPVELHHSIWSFSRDRIPTPGVEAFWDRRERIDGRPQFCDVDRLCVAALHLLRHVLRNNVRLGHAWELEHMLRRRAGDRTFWDRWQRLHPAPLRMLQVLAFQFACKWFEGAMPPVPQEDWDVLPPRVRGWFKHFVDSPVENLRHSNKEPLWLHLELLPQFADRWSVARRRLLPMRLPEAEQAAGGSYWGYVAKRGRYHMLALARALASGSRARMARVRASHTSN